MTIPDPNDPICYNKPGPTPGDQTSPENIICQRCFGKGWYFEYHGNSVLITFKTITECPDCHGEGTIEA